MSVPELLKPDNGLKKKSSVEKNLSKQMLYHNIKSEI